MQLKELIFGPQITGLLLIIIGFIQQKFPPKKINDWYGYRTPMAKKNQRNWDEGNRYSAKLFIKIGVVMVIAGVIVSVLLHQISSKSLKDGLTFITMIGGSMAGVLVMMSKTERHLEKFEEDEE